MEFIKGMDISMVKELEVSGASYYINGKQEDLFRILKECGTTMVRLRIGQTRLMRWVTPTVAGAMIYRLP